MNRLVRFSCIFAAVSLCSISCVSYDDYDALGKRSIFIDRDPRLAKVEEVADVPENSGVENMLKNIRVMMHAGYTLQSGFLSFGAGERISGLVYSSTRYEDLFCPNNVSLWTYLSAANDPDSYFYTRDISYPPYSIRGTASAYYGQVCSSFVQYALGIKFNFQIYQMTVWEGLDILPDQDVDSMKIGDVLTTLSGHTRIVTGVRRKGPVVTEMEISEGVYPLPKVATYSRKEVKAMLEDGYGIYRYRYLSDVTHSPSLFFMNDSSPYLDISSMNTCLMPKRGDRANWRKDEDVVVDLLDKEDFTRFDVYKDGLLYVTGALEEGKDEIDLGVLPYGKYKMCLANETRESEYVYWIVVDYGISAKTVSPSSIEVGYSSMNATPVWLTWRVPWASGLSNNDMPQWTTVIDGNDASKGLKTSTLPDHLKDKRGLSWDIKVAFETEYGILTSDPEHVELY